MNIPKNKVPIQEIILEKNIKLFIKREDLIHPNISGNKYWKLFYNIKNYLEKKPKNPLLITFGGAFSNHIAAVSSLGQDLNLKTLGIIRGEEIESKIKENPTLSLAQKNGMKLWFINREDYRNKEKLADILQKKFPEALILPEGGTNLLALEGIKHLLDADRTKDFNYLCSAVGTGGTLAGISKFANPYQKVLGFKVVADLSLKNKILDLSLKDNFTLFESHFGGYGKITEDNINFINLFYKKYKILLDPIYTGKMMQQLFNLIEQNYFEEGSKILAFHTGGLQGIKAANDKLKKQNKTQILY